MSLLTQYEPKSWFDDFFTTPKAYPPIEIKEEKDYFELTAEIPKMKKEDISVEVKNGVLSISGEKKQAEHKEGYFYSEQSYGKFERSFNLGDNINSENIEAEVKDGTLYIKLFKSVKDSQKIKIK